MTKSTDFYNRNLVSNNCKILGIDNYSVEYYYDSSKYITVKESGEEKAYPPYLVRWAVDFVTYSAVVKPVVKENEKQSGFWPFKYTTYSYDYEAMEKDITKIITDHNARLKFIKFKGVE